MLIGKAYVSIFKYYDTKTKSVSFKKRPVLVIGKADNTDYVVLPISRVSNQNNLDSYFDVPITPSNVPLMNLKQSSYIRTHKQTIINYGELVEKIVDFKKEYEELYIEIILKTEEFQKNLKNAL